MYALNIAEHVCLTRAGRMKQKNGWELRGTRTLPCNLFVFVIDGEAEFRVDGENKVVRAGEILIIPEGTPYSAEAKIFCEYFFAHFSGRITPCGEVAFFPLSREFSFDLPDVSHDEIHFQDVTATGDQFNRVLRWTLSMFEYNSHGTHGGRMMLEAEFLKILMCLEEISETKSSALPITLERIITHIRKNLTCPLRLSDISETFGISQSYISRLFRIHLHTTTSEFINNEKLYYACELIRNTSLNLTEIADYLGFCDVFYFSKLFKKKFGKSPMNYFKE